MVWLIIFARTSVAQPAPADAAPSPDAAAEALFELAESDEARGEYARALDEFDACAARSPSSRYGPRASTRADYLRARSEGHFAPLARLDHVRHDEALANDPAGIDLLARDLEDFPPGPVRVEARMLVAEAYLGRLNRRADAEVELHAVLADPSADPLMARQAARELVDAIIASGDVVRAATEARRQSTRLDPRYVKGVMRLILRRTLDRAAIADLALIGLALGAAIAFSARRGRIHALRVAVLRAAPLVLGFATYVAVLGGYLASKYESGNSTPFFVLGGALVVIIFAARALGAAGSPKPLARVARAVLCGSGALAAAFVVLERLDPAYLDGFGL